jgi:hypothetical protein
MLGDGRMDGRIDRRTKEWMDEWVGGEHMGKWIDTGQ